MQDASTLEYCKGNYKQSHQLMLESNNTQNMELLKYHLGLDYDFTSVELVNTCPAMLNEHQNTIYYNKALQLFRSGLFNESLKILESLNVHSGQTLWLSKTLLIFECFCKLERYDDASQLIKQLERTRHKKHTNIAKSRLLFAKGERISLKCPETHVLLAQQTNLNEAWSLLDDADLCLNTYRQGLLQASWKKYAVALVLLNKAKSIKSTPYLAKCIDIAIKHVSQQLSQN